MKCFGTIWFKELKDKIKEILRNSGIKKQVSKFHIDYENEFKRKLEKGNIQKNQNRQNVDYEATNITNVYDSEYWKWKRVKGYYKEIEDICLDKAIKEAKTIMNS